MEKQLSNFFKIGTLFIGISMLSISCNNEPVEQEIQWSRLEHGKNDFIIRSSINDYPDVKSYAIELSRPRQNALLRSNQETTNFTILEHIDAYIFKDSLSKTYTIPILKTNQTEFGFSNLVIKYVNENPVEEFILNYVPTQDYLNKYVEYNQTPFQGTVEYESLDTFQTGRFSRGCNRVRTTYCNWSKGNVPGEVHEAGPDCTESFMWTEVTVVCEAEPTEIIEQGSSGGGGGTGTGMEPSEDPHTTPIPPDTCETSRGDIGITGSDGCSQESDCAKLKEKISDNEILKNRLHKLTLVDGQTEKGLRADKNPNTGEYQSTPLIENGFRKVKITTNPYTAVVAHSHPDTEVYAMYSGPDIIKMAEVVDRVTNNTFTTVQLTEITHILVTQNNYYALRFDDEASALKLLEIYNNEVDRNDFETILKDTYDDDNTGPPLYHSTTTINKQMAHIYNQFAENGLNMTMYKAEKDANNRPTNWNKINKDNLNEEPCN